MHQMIKWWINNDEKSPPSQTQLNQSVKSRKKWSFHIEMTGFSCRPLLVRSSWVNLRTARFSPVLRVLAVARLLREKKKKEPLRCIMMWVCYCDPPHFCGRPSPRGLTRFCSSFPPVVEWYSGWDMRQKATPVRDSTQEFLLVRMTQDPDICLQRRKKKHSQEETRGGKESAVKWTERANKCSTAAVKSWHRLRSVF